MSDNAFVLPSTLGRDTIHHPPRGHDDHANAAALALVVAEEGGQVIPFDPRAVVVSVG